MRLMILSSRGVDRRRLASVDADTWLGLNYLDAGADVSLLSS